MINRTVKKKIITLSLAILFSTIGSNYSVSADEGDNKIFERWSLGYNAFDSTVASWNIGYGIKENVKLDTNFRVSLSRSKYEDTTPPSSSNTYSYTSEAESNSFSFDVGLLKYLTPKKDYSFFYGGHLGYGYSNSSTDTTFDYYNISDDIFHSYSHTHTVSVDGVLGLEYFILKNLSLSGIYKISFDNSIGSSYSSNSPTDFTNRSLDNSGVLRILFSFE